MLETIIQISNFQTFQTFKLSNFSNFRAPLILTLSALVHVTNIEKNTLIVANTWLLAGENPDLAPFEAEVEAAMISLNPAAPDAFPPPQKRLRLTFDT